MVQERGFNWFEALPRALRIHHDTVDAQLGMSPYQAVFGRDRSVGGLPWPVEKVCPDAQEFFDHMATLGRELAERVNAAHAKLAQRVNANRLQRTPYSPGKWVFLKRPKQVGGMKLQTYWTGPYLVRERVGDSSYTLKLPQSGVPYEAHADQLKECHWEPITSKGVELRVPSGSPK
jgi:hypothetical protein